MTPRPKNPLPNRRQEILEAALRLFAEKGYRATTNADIARAAGVTPAALYYYFPSKQALFRAAVSERRGQIVSAVMALQGDDLLSVPPRDFLALVLRTEIGLLTEERMQALLRIVLAEGPRDPSIVAIWEEMLLDILGPLFPYLQHHMARGNIRQMDPRLFMLMLQGPVLMAVIARDLLKIIMYHDLTYDELVETLAETTLTSLLTEKA
ncbi:MAG: TetR/AcrR family transcriptional regulator [Bacteroidota bacterium]